MARRRTSRVTALVLAAVGVVAIGAFAVNRHQRPAGTTKLLADQPGPRVDEVVAALPQNKPQSMLLADGKPTTTKPADAAPATRPVEHVDSAAAAALLQKATALREAGDLVTARDALNGPLVNGALGGGDADDVKAFCTELNDKIIFGTQKFPADAYNKTWQVAPGTALSKLAKRFDVTAELLCKVNGLSSPDKLKAGITIKAIQGPFHLVVSKSKFAADLYLGDAGGASSLYLKTFKVGLGSDGSTPTGTWLVDTGKVKNPVYYSARGEGVIAADDPKNPLGERWMPLKGIEGKCVGQQSYGIHGTIDPSSIGKNMSQGCIRLASADILELYDLLVEQKSKVKVVD